LYALLVVAIAALLIACEQQPGEITGRAFRADGRPASVKVQVVDAKGTVVFEGSSDYLSGSWYTGETIKPGTYTVCYFSATGEHYEGKDQQVTVRTGGSEAVSQTL